MLGEIRVGYRRKRPGQMQTLEDFLELYNKQMSAQESCIPCSTGETCCDPSDAESGNHLPERGFVPIEDIMRSDKRRGSKGVSGEILKMAANGKMGCFYLAVPRTVGKR